MAVTLIQAPSNALRTLYYATKQCTAYAPEPFNVVEQDKAEKIVMNAIKSGHDSILEHVSFTFKLSDISRACTHQLVRHRMASYCVAGYTRISTSSQKTDKMTIADICAMPKQYRDTIKVRYADKYGELKYSKADGFIYSGKKPVYRLTTAHGYTIDATADHQFLTDNGWKRLGDLIVGKDFVMINGQPAYKNSEWLNQKYNVENLSQAEIGEMIHKHESLQATRHSMVTNIEYVGVTDVYDVMMPIEEHNFIANGFVAHNCQCSQRYVNAENASTKIPEKIRTLPDLYQEAQQLSEQCHAFYKKCIDNGIPKEDARYFLPEGTFTSIVCTMNCRELIHFFNLRCCYRAQWEIRNVAWGMLKMCRKVMPYVFNEVGPQCWRLGHCPEVRKCYQYDASIDMCSKNKEQKPKVDVEEPTNKSIYENV